MTSIAVPPGYELCEMPDGGFARLVGPLFIRHTEAGPRFAFRAQSKHVNARGVLHGGMITTFADQVLGLTIQRLLDTIDIATVNLNCDFVAVARVDDLIEGEATVTRVTTRLIFVKGTITCGDAVLTNASGIWARIRSSA